MPENERKTEALVERRLRRHGYFAPGSHIIVEKQQSDVPRIRKLLVNASKRGNGAGYPEFIIHSDLYPEFLVVVECKANPRRHESPSRDKYGDYAVDGVLPKLTSVPRWVAGTTTLAVDELSRDLRLVSKGE